MRRPFASIRALRGSFANFEPSSGSTLFAQPPLGGVESTVSTTHTGSEAYRKKPTMGLPDLASLRTNSFARRTWKPPPVAARPTVWLTIVLLFCWYLSSGKNGNDGLSVEDVIRGLSSRYAEVATPPWYANPAFRKNPLVYTPRKRGEVVKMLFLADIEGTSALAAFLRR